MSASDPERTFTGICGQAADKLKHTRRSLARCQFIQYSFNVSYGLPVRDHDLAPVFSPLDQPAFFMFHTRVLNLHPGERCAAI